uniref:Glutaminase n=1 Tax=Panagrolaimus sp. ES5 TaxID=591445 RepID=A0AC34FE18_9BILA
MKNNKDCCYSSLIDRKLSNATLQQWSPSEIRSKDSIAQTINQTAHNLSNAFAIDQQPEDLIYNSFKLPNKEEASIGKLLSLLKNFGLQENDPRLKPMMEKIREIEKVKEEQFKEARDPKHWKLGKADFQKCIAESLSLISRTLQNDLVVPSWNQFCSRIKDIYEKCKPVTEGKVADYIPQLSRFDPNCWGVSICSVDGQRASWGDSKIPFCVQSVSKAFNYSIAASDLGADMVHQYVGQEPSGRLFNDICLDNNNKPHNPMVNSGAIIVSSLIKNSWNTADRFDHMLTEYRKIAGSEYVGFNNAVFLSERATADRNYALSYYMKENKCFPEETKSLSEALDFYFQLCSMEVTCETAAVMAATLANGGVCPITEERCIGSRPCRDVLSLMNSCGMYDYSGQFAFHVGLPAKSGVSGLLIVVIPNLVGIALWSPPLDKMGNSCRGVAFCKELINRFNFHTYDSISHNESEKFDPRKRLGDREKDVVVSLLFASKAGDLNTVRRMYMQGNDLECPDYDKRTALHLAASEGHAEIVRFLLKIAKVCPDPKDRWNRTPLQDAKAEGHINCINLLQKCMFLSEKDHKEKEEENNNYDNVVAESQQNIKHKDKSSKNSTPTKTKLPSNLSLYLYLNPMRQTSVATTIHSTESSSSSDEDEVEEDFRIRLEQKQKELKAYGICRNFSGTFSDSNNVQGNI